MIIRGAKNVVIACPDSLLMLFLPSRHPIIGLLGTRSKLCGHGCSSRFLQRSTLNIVFCFAYGTKDFFFQKEAIFFFIVHVCGAGSEVKVRGLMSRFVSVVLVCLAWSRLRLLLGYLLQQAHIHTAHVAQAAHAAHAAHAAEQKVVVLCLGLGGHE